MPIFGISGFDQKHKVLRKIRVFEDSAAYRQFKDSAFQKLGK